MGLDSAIARFRRRDREIWRSEGKVTRASTEAVEFDEDTGDETPADPTLVYEGPLQVRSSRQARRHDAEAGEREVRIAALEAKFPANTAVFVDDVLEVTASIYDADLVGRTFRLTDVLRDDWQISRVAQLEEVTP